MTQCGFKQRLYNGFFLKVKANGLMHKKSVTKIMAVFAIFSCSLCKSRKWEIMIKLSNIVLREKQTFYINKHMKISNFR